MLPIFPNNNLGVSQVIALACMQGQLLKEGAVCAGGGGRVVMLLIPLCFFHFRLLRLVVANGGRRHLVMLRVQGEKGEQSKAHLSSTEEKDKCKMTE